jgi:hypothetical protein
MHSGWIYPEARGKYPGKKTETIVLETVVKNESLILAFLIRRYDPNLLRSRKTLTIAG